MSDSCFFVEECFVSDSRPFAEEFFVPDSCLFVEKPFVSDSCLFVEECFADASQVLLFFLGRSGRAVGLSAVSLAPPSLPSSSPSPPKDAAAIPNAAVAAETDVSSIN